jgi:hypothetical protein
MERTTTQHPSLLIYLLLHQPKSQNTTCHKSQTCRINIIQQISRQDQQTNSPQSTVLHVKVSRLALSNHVKSRRKLRSLYQEVASLRDVLPTYHTCGSMELSILDSLLARGYKTFRSPVQLGCPKSVSTSGSASPKAKSLKVERGPMRRR